MLPSLEVPDSVDPNGREAVVPPSSIDYRHRTIDLHGSRMLCMCFAAIAMWVVAPTAGQPAEGGLLLITVVLALVFGRVAYVLGRHPAVRFDDAGMHVLRTFPGSVASVPWSAFARGNAKIVPSVESIRVAPVLRRMPPAIELVLEIGDSGYGRDLPLDVFITTKGVALGRFAVARFEVPPEVVIEFVRRHVRFDPGLIAVVFD